MGVRQIAHLHMKPRPSVIGLHRLVRQVGLKNPLNLLNLLDIILTTNFSKH